MEGPDELRTMRRRWLSVVCGGRDATAMSCPVCMEELTARFVDALVGVRAEVVALGLEEISGQTSRAVAIIEGKRGREGRSGHAKRNRAGECATPGFLVLVEYAGEEAVEQEIAEVGSGLEGVFDFAEEAAADDASTAPHQSDATHVEIPAVLLRRCSKQHVALGIRNDFRAVECAANVLDEC